MMKKAMKAIKAVIVFMVICFAVIHYSETVHAEGVVAATEYSQFMTALQQVDAKEQPDENAGTAFSYDAGASIFVTGETNNGWYIVFYQGKTGYINKGTSQDILEVQEIDLEALDEEMAAQEVENQILIEEVERYRAEVRRSRIWGIVIALLVIGIFAVGITSTVLAEKRKKADESEEDQDEDEILDLNE